MNASESSSEVAPWPVTTFLRLEYLLPAWQGPTNKADFSFFFFFFFISSQLGKPSCLGGSRQDGFPSLDSVPTPLGHLVSLGNSCCCFGRGQTTKGHVLGRWLAGLTLVILTCLLSPIDCCVACQIVCSLHTAFCKFSSCVGEVGPWALTSAL